MEETCRSLSRRFVTAAANARFDIKFNVLLNARPVIILHEGTVGFLNCKVISQLIVVQSQKLLTGYTVVGRDTESAFEIEEAVLELEERVSIRILDDRSEKYVIRVAGSDRTKNVRVKFGQGDWGQERMLEGSLVLFFGLNIWIPRKGVSSGIGDPRDVVDLGTESG
jgi:hypothetical protein